LPFSPVARVLEPALSEAVNSVSRAVEGACTRHAPGFPPVHPRFTPGLPPVLAGALTGVLAGALTGGSSEPALGLPPGLAGVLASPHSVLSSVCSSEMLGCPLNLAAFGNVLANPIDELIALELSCR